MELMYLKRRPKGMSNTSPLVRLGNRHLPRARGSLPCHIRRSGAADSSRTRATDRECDKGSAEDDAMELNLDRVRENVRQADTEDLLDRATVYRDGMEPEAILLIEAELRARGVTEADILAH